MVNFAVRPAVEVQIDVRPDARRRARRVTVRAENFGETFAMDPDAPRMDIHPLLQHTIASARVPAAVALDIRISSPVPPGISTGTSASVCVALLGALDALTPGRRGAAGDRPARPPRRNRAPGAPERGPGPDRGRARRDHAHPDAEISRFRGPSPSPFPGRTWDELDRRLVLVYLGRPHRSTAMHERVIAALEAGGPQKRTLAELSRIAREAHLALLAGDLASLGECMVRNNEKQRALSSGLVSASADAVSAVARRFKAAGWKVNGAGGRGGSMAVLAAEDDGLRRRMIAAIDALGKGIRVIPISLSPRGLSVWDAC